jgi:hypothetical protein
MGWPFIVLFSKTISYVTQTRSNHLHFSKAVFDKENYARNLADAGKIDSCSKKWQFSVRIFLK